MSTTDIAAPDLTQRPPRSPRCRLGGIAILPRMLDKGRALIAGKNGEYNYNCPLDRRLAAYMGFDPEALREQLAAGKGDGEILEWLLANSKNKREPWEVEQWSEYQQRRGPDSDAETLQFWTERVTALSKTREDVNTFADLLDLDDYVTFGGKA